MDFPEASPTLDHAEGVIQYAVAVGSIWVLIPGWIFLNK